MKRREESKGCKMRIKEEEKRKKRKRRREEEKKNERGEKETKGLSRGLAGGMELARCKH